MEPQTQQTQQNEDHSNNNNSNSNSNNNNNKGSSSSNFVCRQSSTRWTPTTDQIRILKELYYNNGVRSPSAEQIQRISARLRQYGKIEGKNVFYWFQNHKARERQKKRFTNSDPSHLPTPILQISSNASAYHESFNKFNYHNISASPAGVSSASASCIAVDAQMGNYGYGSMTMEKSFRDCSISSTAGGTSSTGNRHGGGSNGHHNFGSWVGVDHHHPYHHHFDKRSSSSSKPGFDDLDDDQEAAFPEIETLPLFPMHGEDIHGFGNIKSTSDGYYSGCYRPDDGGNGLTSLELSLNSYGHMTPADYFRSY